MLQTEQNRKKLRSNFFDIISQFSLIFLTFGVFFETGFFLLALKVKLFSIHLRFKMLKTLQEYKNVHNKQKICPQH